jgi:hypothetical protein
MFLNIALFLAPLAYISYKIVEYCSPGKAKQFLMLHGWNAIQCCSYVEIKAIAAYAKVRSYLPSTDKEQTDRIIFIKSEQEMVYDIDSFLKSKEEPMLLSEIDYDFILYEKPVKIHNKIIKCIMRFENSDDIKKIEYISVNYYKFNAIQFNFKDEEQIISINFQDNQFFVTGNILFDRKFIKWYMYKFHSISINDDDSYYITFIDHLMSYVMLDENRHILIMKHNYDIIENDIIIGEEETNI